MFIRKTQGLPDVLNDDREVKAIIWESVLKLSRQNWLRKHVSPSVLLLKANSYSRSVS